MRKLKQKFKTSVFSLVLIIILLSGLGGFFVYPKTAKAAGNVYNFSDIVLTETVEVSNNQNGPWNNVNFVRVGKDSNFYVKVTIQVASLKNTNNQVVTSFDTKNDSVFNPGWYNTNFSISGVGSSFVAKVTQEQAAAIKQKIEAGADPKTVGGIPCFKESMTSGGGAALNGVVIVGASAAVALTGGAALSAGALAVGGSAVGTAAGAAVQNVALFIAINGSTVAGGSTAATLATFRPAAASDYIKCDGPIGGSNQPGPQSPGAVPVGGTLFSSTVTVPATAYANLGLSQQADATKESSTQPVNEFFVVPNVYFSSWLGVRNDFMSTIGAGKSIYVQLYDTQENANKHASEAVPSSVPNNGSNTGSGTNLGDGGSGLLGLINKIIGIIVGILSELAYLIFYTLLAPMIQAMLSIHTYSDTFVGVIYPAWIVVRNVCNIIFIVAIIAIAMGTLFRVESYQYKHLLVQLIIAALLVNFSLVIGQAILGIADTAQNQFLPNNVEVVRSLGKNLMVQYRPDVWNMDFAGHGYFSDTVKQLFFLAMSLGSLAVFAAIAVFLVIRIVALWIFLMISPIAYVAGVLPTTAKYRSEWWSNFIKYAFFTPIMAFMLNIAAYIANMQTNNGVLNYLKVDPSTLGGSNFASFVVQISSNVILLVFLFAATMVAEKMGIYGGDIVSKVGKQGLLAPFAGAKFLTKDVAGGWVKKHYDKKTEGLASGKILPGLFGDKGGQWLSRQLFKVAHPITTVGKIREESKEERELYKARVEAAAVKVARKQFGWRRMTEDPMYLFDEHKGKELYEKEEGQWSPNEQVNVGKINRLAEESKKGDLRARVKLKFALAEAFRNRNLNEVMGGENGLAARNPELFGGPLNYNADNIRFFFQQMTEGGYLDEDFTREFLKDIGRDAYEKGDFNGAELVYSDPKTGHPHMIHMAPRDEEGNSLPVGWNDYVQKREEFIRDADAIGKRNAVTVGKAKAVTKATKNLGPGATPAQIAAEAAILEADEIERATGPEIAKALKALEDPYAESNHDYANSMHAERGRNYMKINLSKKKGGQQMDMFHDSLINVGVEDGEAVLSDAGTQALGKIDEQSIYALLRDNMAPKTKDKFKLYTKGIAVNEAKTIAKIQNQLTKVVRDENREKGVFMTDPEIAKQVESRTNLWLAASAGLASGEQAQTVMRAFELKTDPNTNITETLAERDLRVRAELIKKIKDSQK